MKALVGLFSNVGFLRRPDTIPVTGAGCRVHYTWVCREPFQPTPKQRFPVPPNSFERAFINAQRYPAAQIQFWFDPRFVPEEVLNDMEAYIKERNCPNIKIRSLLTIKGYTDNIHFAPGVGAPNPLGHEHKDFELYARADLVRVEVMNADLNGELEDAVLGEKAAYKFWADWDMPDLGLNLPDLAATLNRFGIGFCLAKGSVLENGYFACRSDKVDSEYFQDLLINSRKSFLSGDSRWGFGAFSHALERWGHRYNKSASRDSQIEFNSYGVGVTMPAVVISGLSMPGSGTADAVLVNQAPSR
ncbi:MAG: hypothetical protein GC136_01460 [Alphaproteobacteria bacterium]|nr:hypothetical protein [Alphaproteobacteria bacterium]